MTTSTLSYELNLAGSSPRHGTRSDGTQTLKFGFSVTADTDWRSQNSTDIELNTRESQVSDSQFATSTDNASADKVCLASDSPDQKVLEYFSGKVEQITDGIAFVCLTSPSGERLMGKYSASELEMKDIREGDWFDCETVEETDKIAVRITKRRRIPLSDEMLRRMDEELDIDFAGME